MASTTKIMTCILALENGELTDEVEISEEAASQPQVKLGVRSGQNFYLIDLLYSLMLESHNDAAVAIAEHVGGSVQGFADMMNEKAAVLDCDSTYFITPNGLDAEDENGIHHTTARDLARIMKYCNIFKHLPYKLRYIWTGGHKFFIRILCNRGFQIFFFRYFFKIFAAAVCMQFDRFSRMSICFEALSIENIIYKIIHKTPLKIIF